MSSGSRSRRVDAARSSTRSCDPIATTVREISGSDRSSWTSTSSPACRPSRPAGTSSRPSARTSDVSTPAPRGSGVATTRPATRPSRTRTQSSMPPGEASLRASRAVVVWRRCGAAPSSAASSGAAKMSKVRAADTGNPGAPRTGVASTTPITTGCPGRTATPCTASTPSSATTCAVQSSRPALEPASTMTRSLTAAASWTARAIRLGWSGTTSVTVTSAPSSRACSASINELVSGISPGPSGVPTGRISSPVGSTVTRGDRRTTTSVTPAAAAAARSTGRSRCPAGSSSSVAATSSPIDRTLVQGAMPARSSARASAPDPLWCTSSRITTASRPAGIGSPVSTTSNASGASSSGVLSLAP